MPDILAAQLAVQTLVASGVAPAVPSVVTDSALLYTRLSFLGRCAVDSAASWRKNRHQQRHLVWLGTCGSLGLLWRWIFVLVCLVCHDAKDRQVQAGRKANDNEGWHARDGI